MAEEDVKPLSLEKLSEIRETLLKAFSAARGRLSGSHAYDNLLPAGDLAAKLANSIMDVDRRIEEKIKTGRRP